MTEQTKQQGEWVILEAMGHRTAAGRYYFENGLHRVDIPDVSPEAAPDAFIRTERYGGSSIYCITSVDEATARLTAKACVIPEAIPYDVRRELQKMIAPGETREAIAARLPRDIPIGEGPGEFDSYDEEQAERDEEWHNPTVICEGCGGETGEGWSTCTCDDDFVDDLPETEL